MDSLRSVLEAAQEFSAAVSGDAHAQEDLREYGPFVKLQVALDKHRSLAGVAE